MMTMNNCIRARRRTIHTEEEASRNEDHFLRLPQELLVSVFHTVAYLSSLCRCSLVSLISCFFNWFGWKIHNEEEPSSSDEDHFLRLPEDLLLEIFHRVADVNSLCRCALVSKYFASVVYRVQTISVVVGDVQPIEKVRAQSLNEVKLVKFLKHFRDLKSIYLVDTWLLESRPNSIFTNSKVKFSSDGTRMERFVTLLPDLDLISLDSVSEVADGILLFYLHLIRWMCLVCELVKGHSSLRRVFIADSEKHGKLFMVDEQLNGVNALRNGVKVLFEDEHPATLQVHHCQVPVLRLPSSGYVMSKVCFVSIRIYSNESSADANSIDEMLSWDFEDEEKVLGEATKEIFKHHRDMIKSETLYVDFTGS